MKAFRSWASIRFEGRLPDHLIPENAHEGVDQVAKMTLAEIKVRFSTIDRTRMNATTDGDITALAGVLVAGTGCSANLVSGALAGALCRAAHHGRVNND
ncbi:hypothetical protein JK207_16075 [Gluconobacter cerinus]|uniref:hypothetical protein n=1 Tax=Gluconobacter cerinus TaxID=38307 RepID=UPI001B8AF0D9|nr:hypothetical protein [Gluconobacter cerinus]MBS1023509.1 hypothetical protein [Gluconobacter cerinus]